MVKTSKEVTDEKTALDHQSQSIYSRRRRNQNKMTPEFIKSLHCPNCGANVAEDCVSCGYCNAVLTKTACASCFGPIFKGMKFCPFCGAAVVERDEVKIDKKLKCPRCEKVLEPVEIAGARLQECTSCGGLWLDKDTFQKICDDKEKQEKTLLFTIPLKPTDIDFEDQPKRMYVPCPACGSYMQRKNFAGCSGVIIDWCMPHGTWFDRQELQQIVSFIKEGGLAKVRKNEIESLREEQNRLRELQFGQNQFALDIEQKRSFTDLDVNQDSLLGVIVSLCRKIF